VADVVELVAECELVETSGSRTSFDVVEYAVLSDGRRVTLLDDRGWSQTTHGLAPGETWPLTADDVRRDVLNVVLPDDAETSGEEHEWRWFVERLHDAGVDVTRDELRALPYRIAFGERLRAALQ
jgi:hypothetical protein